jgi:hypothetical protein
VEELADAVNRNSALMECGTLLASPGRGKELVGLDTGNQRSTELVVVEATRICALRVKLKRKYSSVQTIETHH